MRLLTPLLSHQRAAVEKVERLRVGALLMEMGTGKSRCAIELAYRRRDRISRVIWFCPVSLKQTIHHEIQKHSCEEFVHCFDDKTSDTTLPGAFWYVVGLESMSASRRVQLAANRLVDSRAMVIVDESSYIKGHRSARTDWITRISERARYRLILTGTPISQGVQDLFAQMRFLSPDILGYNSYYTFSHNHLEYSKKYKGMVIRAHNLGYLAARIAPYSYQVTKQECLDLPSKLYKSIYFDMTREQRALYEEAKHEILLSIDEEEFSSITIYRLFTALQQICCGFWNRFQSGPRFYSTGWEYNPPDADYGATIETEHLRLDALSTALDRIPPGEKVVIWAKYRRCIKEINELLRERTGQPPALFYGDLSENERHQQLQRFRSDTQYLVATPSCGGHGLTLTDAAYVVFYTDSFKYSEHLQAEDRCHRIGATRPVTYISIVCSQSIDIKIQDALSRKGNAMHDFRSRVNQVREKRTLKQALKELASEL